MLCPYRARLLGYLRVQQLQSLQNQNRHTGVSKWQVTGAFQAACQTDHAAAKQCPIARCVVSKLFVRHHLLIGRARQEMSKTTDMLVHVVSDSTSHPFSLTVVSLQLIHQSTTLQHSLTSRDVKDPRHARPHCQWFNKSSVFPNRCLTSTAEGAGLQNMSLWGLWACLSEAADCVWQLDRARRCRWACRRLCLTARVTRLQHLQTSVTDKVVVVIGF